MFKILRQSFTINNKDIFTFTDMFFDNIFSDWMVHSRITDAKKNLRTVFADVQRVLNQLARKRDEMNDALEKLDEEEREIIAS